LPFVADEGVIMKLSELCSSTIYW